MTKTEKKTLQLDNSIQNITKDLQYHINKNLKKLLTPIFCIISV